MTVFRIQNNLDYFRMGISFKTKASSVQRNRVKRCIREAFRQNAEKLKGFDFNILIPNRYTLNYGYVKQLRQSLEEEIPKWAGN